MGVADKIADIEAEIARTQKNKATEHHLGLLKAKLAKYRAELAQTRPSAVHGEGFEVQKSGDARVVLIGFPSVGKSTLLSTLTPVFSRQAATEFTTLECIAGRFEHRGASIQLLDLPGIIDGAAANRGRGRQVLGIARTADLILMMLDPRRPHDCAVLTRELAAMGVRLNRQRPDVTLVRRGTSIDISTTLRLSCLDEATIAAILREYKIHGCQLTIREDITADDLIDVITGSAVYIDCLYCYNKIEELSYRDFLQLVRPAGGEGLELNERLGGLEGLEGLEGQLEEPGELNGEAEGNVCETDEGPLPYGLNDPFPLSCHCKWNIEELKEEIWKRLRLVRVYTRKRGDEPDFSGPAVLRAPATIKDLCRSIHKDFYRNFKYAHVWGRSACHSPQRVGLSHEMCDEDVVQLYMK